MSVLNDLNVAGDVARTNVVKRALAYAFWTQWYPAHKDDVIARVLFLKTVRVRDVKFVFVLIFGQEP